MVTGPKARFWKRYHTEGDGVAEKARQELETKLAAQNAPLVPADIACKPMRHTGRASMAILEYARDEAIHLLVASRHSPSTLANVLPGVVAERVLDKAEGPGLRRRPARAD